MIIGVDARLLSKNDTDDIPLFTSQVLIRLPAQHPEHKFYFFFDRPHNDALIFQNNVIPVVLSPPANNGLQLKYWYDIKLTAALKKYDVTVFLSLDAACSLRTKLPQCLIVHDLNFLHQPNAYQWNRLLFYRYFTPKFIKKATQIITLSQVLKTEIIQRYKTDPQKVDVVHAGVAAVFQPCSLTVKVLIKQKYTEGREYFICTDTGANSDVIINLLKAFSLFKKRQRSNWKLVLIETIGKENKDFTALLQTYKYREDVVLTSVINSAESAQLIGSAYGAVYPFPATAFTTSLLQAMKCNVPCIAVASAVIQEAAGDAAIYFDASNPTDIADKLMLLYKDEVLHAALKEKSEIIASKYNWQSTADSIWQSLKKAANVESIDNL